MSRPDGIHPTLFLDRDGTINVDLITEYLGTIEKTELITGSGRAIVRAQQAGFKISVITNQAGIGKGLTNELALPLVHKQLEKLITEEAGLKTDRFRFDDIRYCPHLVEEKCKCRKPGVKMLEESALKLNSDLERSFFIGDRETDLQAAAHFGIPSILVLTGHGLRTADLIKKSPHLVSASPLQIFSSLEEAVPFLIQLIGAGSH